MVIQLHGTEELPKDYENIDKDWYYSNNSSLIQTGITFRNDKDHEKEEFADENEKEKDQPQ